MLFTRWAPMAVAVAALLSAPSLARAEFQDHRGLNQRVLVICVKTSDRSTTRRTAAQWISVLNNQVNPFILQASYGQTSYQFERPTGVGVPADGWFELPYPITSWPGTTQGARDAVKLADPFVNMSRYNRVTVIVNNPDFGGQCTDYQWIPVDEGRETTQILDGVSREVRLMSVSAENEWLKDSYWSTALGNTRDEAASVIAHELGHQLRLPTHYGDVRWEPNMVRDSITPWDNMGLSPGWNDYIAWARYERGWLPLSDISTVGPPSSSDITRTLTLYPVQSLSGRRAVRIPFSGGATFEGYYLEYRRNDSAYTNRDSWGNALQEGVLVTLVSENPDVVFGHKALVMPNPAFPNDASRATLRTGDFYEDAARGIRIDCISAGGSSAVVVVTYRRPPTNFNANIRPWSAPPYETPDIWIDSEKNGWGTYRYLDLSTGDVAGNGDDAWVRQLPDGSWKVNRVYVQVRNTGPDPMSNVRVQMWVNDPPGLGDSGASWAFLGTIIFPSVPGYSARREYVNWAPTVAAHTCIRAVIESYPNETNSGDNTAQENVSAFDTTASSPYQPVKLNMVVGNPLAIEMPVQYQVTNIPKRWKWQIIPETDVLPPSGQKDVTLILYPPNPYRDTDYKQGQIFRPQVTSLMQIGDEWFPIGGVEVWTHLVYKADINVGWSPTEFGILAKGRLRSLQPVRGGLANQKVAVQLIYTDPANTFTMTRVVTTNDKGYFRALFSQVPQGKYVLQACYAGDMNYQSVDSPDVEAWH